MSAFIAGHSSGAKRETVIWLRWAKLFRLEPRRAGRIVHCHGPQPHEARERELKLQYPAARVCSTPSPCAESEAETNEDFRKGVGRYERRYGLGRSE